jgi:hypothetical protein
MGHVPSLLKKTRAGTDTLLQPGSHGDKECLGFRRLGSLGTKAIKANRPRGRGAKPQDSEVESAGLPPQRDAMLDDLWLAGEAPRVFFVVSHSRFVRFSRRLGRR